VVAILTLSGLENALPIYAHLFTWATLVFTLGAAAVLWRNGWRTRSQPVVFCAMVMLALFTLGPGYGSQYWWWALPLLIICYPNVGGELRRVIVMAMVVIVVTEIFEFAVELNLGRYLYNFSPSAGLQSLSDYFAYPSRHLIWLRMPMTLAAFLVLIAGCLELLRGTWTDHKA
jgi:hypothetical protein